MSGVQWLGSALPRFQWLETMRTSAPYSCVTVYSPFLSSHWPHISSFLQSPSVARLTCSRRRFGSSNCEPRWVSLLTGVLVEPLRRHDHMIMYDVLTRCTRSFIICLGTWGLGAGGTCTCAPSAVLLARSEATFIAGARGPQVFQAARAIFAYTHLFALMDQFLFPSLILSPDPCFCAPAVITTSLSRGFSW